MKKAALLVLIVLVFMYLLLGAGVFHALEHEEEVEIREDIFAFHRRLRQRRNETVCRHLKHGCKAQKEAVGTAQPSCVPRDHMARIAESVADDVAVKFKDITGTGGECVDFRDTPIFLMTERELYEVIDRAVQATKHGLDPRSTAMESSPPQWEFAAALAFSITVVTTIGYGFVTPKTGAGMAFCVIYGLLGIPFMLAVLGGIGEIMANGVRRGTEALRRRRPGWLPRRVRRLVAGIFFVSGVTIFWLLPSIVVSHVEGWSYSESLYFSFISLSTIGFGDYVAGLQRGIQYWEPYRILMTMVFVVGLAFLATVFQLMSQGVQILEETVDKKTERELRRAVEVLELREQRRKRLKENSASVTASKCDLNETSSRV
ncbi:potassium channel subfamily K member 17-like [Branchiostoma lanceolatum]|uniref:potassium channel subfamily K member 17-like n=1 Tax=Branchiostoma lanceolatum TaxID=7740 RepID=UPI00345483A6